MVVKVSESSLHQFNALLIDLDHKINDSEIAKFLSKHEVILNDLSLALMDIYCLRNAPLTLLNSFLFAFIAPECVQGLSNKVSHFWVTHPHTQPLLIAGAVVVATLEPETVISITCGTHSARRLQTRPAAQTWTSQLSNWLWSTATPKHE